MADDARPRRPIWAIRWIFADRQTGRLVIAQWPNWPLWIFICVWGLNAVMRPGGAFGLGLKIVAGVSLAIWASDEIVRGACPFRRALGAMVLLVEIVAWARP